MSSTNKTAKLGLSQFLGTDKPAWLGDYNSDMQKIDDAYANLEQSGQSSTADIAALQQRDEELTQNINDVNDRVDTVFTDIITLGNRATVLEGNYDTMHHEVALLTEKVENMDEEYLPLTGGTVKGNIVNESSVFRMNSDNLTKGEVPASDSYMQLRFQDKKNTSNNNDCLARLVYVATANGGSNLDMIACKNEANSLSVAKLSVGFDSNGKEFAQAPTPKSINDKSKAIATTEWVYSRYENFRIYKGTIAGGATLTIGLRPYSGMYELMTGHDGNTNLIGDYKVFGTNANTLNVIAKVKEAAELTVTATNGGLTVKNNGTSTCEYVFIRYYCADNTDVTFS